MKPIIKNNQLNKIFVEDLVAIENKIIELKKIQETYKSQLLQEMQKKNIIKLESDLLNITYIEEFDRETFNTKKFKEEHQDLYDEYITMTKVKPSIRIKINEKLED